MSDQSVNSRRNFFRVGLTAAGVAVAGRSFAQMCSDVVTGVQPLGPFFPQAGTPEQPVQEDKSQPIHLANDSDLTVVKGKAGQAKGQIVYVRGQLTGKDCRSIAGATIIIWQASESGRYNHVRDSVNHDFAHPKTGETIQRELDASFQYWGKAVTDAEGRYEFKTIVPGFYPADLQDGWYRPPHIHMMVSAMGYPQMVTQMYFRGSELINNDFIQELNQSDYLLQSESLTAEQRDKLIVDFARDPLGQKKDGLVGNFDIVLTR